MRDQAIIARRGQLGLKIEGDRGHVSGCIALVDCLDVIAIRVQNERGIIPRMIGPDSGCPIIAPTMRQGGAVKSINRFAIFSLKSNVVPPGQLARRGWAVGGGYGKFIRDEVTVIRAKNRYPQHEHHRCIEAFARGQVAHYKLNMINQAATMQLHWFLFLSVKCFERRYAHF